MKITFSDDGEPGITRKRMRNGWGYFDATGARIADRGEIDRLNAIGLPPAYRDAWFSPDPSGHIQAVGRDGKGRKQYRYHTSFRETREATKYEGCAVFGTLLPKLRAKVEADLKLRGVSREKAVAAVVRLLDIGHIRVGNEGYVKSGNSFGATTLRNRHAVVAGSSLKLKFRAKSGRERVMTITDGSLSRFVRKCQDLPGQHLFQWLDSEGEPHPVSSGDVNEYIRAAMGDSFTAKHFRTWSASVIAFGTLAGAKQDLGLKTVLEPVSAALGNTPAIARKSYVHPALLALAKTGQGAFRDSLRLPRTTRYLSRTERGLIAFLAGTAAARAA